MSFNIWVNVSFKFQKSGQKARRDSQRDTNPNLPLFYPNVMLLIGSVGT